MLIGFIMGNSGSSSSSSSQGDNVGARRTSFASSMDARIVASIKKIGEENKAGGNDVQHLDKVILMFPKIQAAFRYLRDAFASFDKNGDKTLDYGELEAMMSRLGVELSEKDMKEIFDEADVYKDGALTYQEFVTSLALGYVLHIIPSLEESGNQAQSNKPRSASDLYGMGDVVRDAFDVAIKMYFVFDTTCSGCINKNDMHNTMEKAHKHSPSKRLQKKYSSGAGNAPTSHTPEFLTSARWEELDFDKNGVITFQKFFYTFVRWVTDLDGIEDEEDQKILA